MKFKINIGESQKGKHLESGLSTFGYMWFYFVPIIQATKFDLVHGQIKSITLRWLCFFISFSCIKLTEYNKDIKSIW